jgi:hypothetical protein
VIIPPAESPGDDLVRDAASPSMAPPLVDAELAELDAGWD